jgi:1-acyl-sn-glycerol-3-phosphate acyltransferase
MIRTLSVAAFLFWSTLLILPWLVLWTLLTGNPEFMYRCAMSALRAAVRLGGIRVRVEGLENIPARACIFASNHASNVDPPILTTAIPRRVAILVKKEVFRIPIFSRAMHLSHFVAVDRGSRKAAVSASTTVGFLKAGDSFLMFPEGTRSPDGRLRPFKKGVATMAVEAGVPVVPVSIAGTQKVLKKGSWLLQPGLLTIRFGNALDTSIYSMARRNELLARIAAAVSAGLPPEQQALAPDSRAP